MRLGDEHDTEQNYLRTYGVFVTGAVFFTILLRRSQQLRQEVHELRERMSIQG
jgi:hypothetical protein